MHVNTIHLTQLCVSYISMCDYDMQYIFIVICFKVLFSCNPVKCLYVLFFSLNSKNKDFYLAILESVKHFTQI